MSQFRNFRGGRYNGGRGRGRGRGRGEGTSRGDGSSRGYDRDRSPRQPYNWQKHVKPRQEFRSVSCVNIPEQKIAQVRANLDGIKKLCSEPGDRYLFGDAPEFNPNKLSESRTYEESVKNAIESRTLYRESDESGWLRDEFLTNQEKFAYQQMMKFREKLPAFRHREEIIDLIDKNQVILVTGETGCGKTTQVPQFILDQCLERGKGAECRIVCTQPRRIAAISMADRVSSERAEKLGESVGFQIRLENKFARSEGGTITYCTTGILLKKLECDPTFADTSHLILDEIHERNVDSDLLLGILKMIINYRTDLKIILMSATLRADLFSEYFNNCPRIHIEGMTFPVEEKYLEDVLEEIKFTDFPPEYEKQNRPKWHKYTKRGKGEDHSYNKFKEFIQPFARSLEGKYSRNTIKSLLNSNSEIINVNLVAELIFHINETKPPGAILVFLTGYDQISKLNIILSEGRRTNNGLQLSIFPLHSMMPTINQKEIFHPSPPNKRKVVLSTNIAETSITIDDVVYVINCGKHKQNNYDIINNIQTLGEEWISIANARQRKGRAGRVQPGICYHLYTSARSYTFEEYPKPEIERQMVESTILAIKILHLGDAVKLFNSLLSSPKMEVIAASIELLKRLRALNEDETLTALGYHLARLPLDPKTGKMILLGAIFNCLDPITTVAANLSFKDPFMKPLGKEKEVDRTKLKFAKSWCSDHLMMANVVEEWRESGMDSGFCYRNFLSMAVLRQLENMKKQFGEILYSMKFIEQPHPEDDLNNRNTSFEHLNLLRAVICAGLYPNLATIRKRFSKKYGILVTVYTPEDKSVKINLSSVNANEKYFKSLFLTYHSKMKTTNKFLYDTTMVHPLPIVFFGDRLNCTEEAITVADYFQFNCNAETRTLILELREILDRILNQKILLPKPVDWDGVEGKLLNIIIEFLSMEDFNEYEEEEGDDMDSSDSN